MSSAQDASASDDFPDRLAAFDRAIRREQLQQRIREFGGVISENLELSESADAGLQLVFFERVLAWEDSPCTSHRNWLARHGLTFAPLESLCRPSALRLELARLIQALAIARVFLYHTDHLSDTGLYARLWSEVLAGESPDFCRTPDDACHWDLADAGSGDEQLWLTYYATDRERRDWVRDFPEVVLPPKKCPPFRRDHRLPVRD